MRHFAISPLCAIVHSSFLDPVFWQCENRFQLTVDINLQVAAHHIL